jgi:hypothetical protein
MSIVWFHGYLKSLIFPRNSGRYDTSTALYVIISTSNQPVHSYEGEQINGAEYRQWVSEDF